MMAKTTEKKTKSQTQLRLLYTFLFILIYLPIYKNFSNCPLDLSK